MSNLNRRSFLQQIAALSAVCVLPRAGRPFAGDTRPFEMLVVGDSLIWGQGLNEPNKFYTLTKNWLEREYFDGKRAVNVKVKAHSGSTMFLHDEEIELVKKSGWDEYKTLHSEVSVGWPSVKTQFDVARGEYDDPRNVDLIMLTAGITDIAVANILNVFDDPRPFRANVPKYCDETMTRLLRHAADAFPNALIAVVGYYPIISKKSSTHAIFNAVLEMYSFPRFTKPLLNNPLTLPILREMRRHVIARSDFWAENSDAGLRAAVDKLNASSEKRRAVFVKSPVTRETCFGTKNALLWGMGRKGRAADPMADARFAACNQAYDEMAKMKIADYTVRSCQLASVGHPNVAGAKAYADAIAKTLSPLLS